MPKSRTITVTDQIGATELLRGLSGHWKIKGWAACHAAGVPTVAGIAVLQWNPTAMTEILRFADSLNATGLLVRTDRSIEVPPYPRAGYVVDLADLPSVLEQIARSGRTAFLLEPLSKYRDRYSVGAAAWTLDGPVHYDIVGPGFDASDLNRGDVSPHETFEVPLLAPGAAANIVSHTVVRQERYEASRRDRIAKIARELKVDDSQVFGYLTATGQNRIIEAVNYVPIPQKFLWRIHENVVGLASRLPSFGLPGVPFVASAGIIEPNDRLVFWDVVWPTKKYG
jgi:hypothetical protein